jgi:outer membrane immunogenic protein
VRFALCAVESNVRVDRRVVARCCNVTNIAEGLTKMTSRLIRTGLLFAAMVAAPLAASAADLPPAYKAPAYVAPAYPTWSGFYVGVNGGYGFGTSSWSVAGFGTPEFDVNGYLIGGTLGYNLQTGAWVWGLEGDFDYSTMNGGTGCGGGTSCNTRLNWLATARGRIGYGGWGNFMPYITGGAAFGQLRMEPAGFGTGVAHDMKIGGVAGAGIEYAFLGNWSAKLEYNYVDLGTATCEASVCGVDTDVKFHTHIVKAGVNYRF